MTTRVMCLMLFSFACTESIVPADAGPLSDASTDFTDSSDDASASEPYDAGVDAPLAELEDTGPPSAARRARAVDIQRQPRLPRGWDWLVESFDDVLDDKEPVLRRDRTSDTASLGSGA